MHTQKHTHKTQNTQGHSQSGCFFSFFCTICPSETKQTLLDITTLSFIYQTMCECIWACVCVEQHFCCRTSVWACVSFVNKNLGPTFNHRAKFHIDRWWDGEPARPPRVLWDFQRGFLKAGREVRRQRYDDVAKDTDFKEALIIFYPSKHTLINLCLRGLSGFLFLWRLFIDCQRLTTLWMLLVLQSSLTVTSEALTSPTLKSGHTDLKVLLIISPHKQIITLVYSFICTFVLVARVTLIPSSAVT